MPIKSKVIKKVVERKPPGNLIDILIAKKASFYDQESRMLQLRECNEKELKELTAEYNSSEDEDMEENFAWFSDSDPDNYFVFATKYKNMINVD